MHTVAHNVVISKTAVFARSDGHLLKGKYTYRVRCKECGDLHDAKITSEGLAELCKANHHIDVHNKHHSAHPNDKAHLRTDRRKVMKMVKPRG